MPQIAHMYLPENSYFFGSEESFDNNKGHALLPVQVLAVCDKTTGTLAGLNRGIYFFPEISFFMIAEVVAKSIRNFIQ